ncbi:MAG: hypothetical protein ACXADC_09145 [Candidatus Thorarchaeota archaeon]|jgi:hypothetical protein
MAITIRSILEPLSIASAVALIDVIIALSIAITDPSVSLLLTTSFYLILEFGMMLIIGACFMSRQPLEVEKRYDEKGKPVRSWVWATRGKKVFISSIFVLMYAIIIGGLGMLL